ncbi:MAG TPA: glycosyltransferase [Thermomicrobiaceae bacterium]|nr:glycosyltransferase [Thermomicrobiaceae bacterium]
MSALDQSRGATPARVALVHDYLNQYGGAERVLEVFHELYPSAPVYTSIYAPELMPPAYRAWDVRASFMQRLPGIHRHHQPYLPLYPLAFRRLRLADVDLVLSDSSAFAKGARVPPSAVHVCYVHSPMRFAWDFARYADRERFTGTLRRALPPLLAGLRRWDIASAGGVDYLIANSSAVARRIAAYWGREASVIYPPVETEAAEPVAPGEVEDYFLLVSRLVPYKRFDVVVDAFNALGLPLKVVGEGRARAELERRAGPTVQFLGAVSDAEKYRLYARCQAALFPAEDDFGIAQVEVQAAGRPAIALAAGGALDTVVDGQTGVLFPEQTPEAIVAAVRRMQSLSFAPEPIARHAARFSRARFAREIATFVSSCLEAGPIRGRALAEARPSWN